MKNSGIPHQYACFGCKKSFKRPQFAGAYKHTMTAEQIRGQSQEAERFNREREYKCPDCGELAVYMGTDFKAPKKTDAKGWRDVQRFIESGKIYYRGSQDGANDS